jgi:hypothetical protein
MPGRGNAGGNNGAGHGRDPDHGPTRGGGDVAEPGRSGDSPGHLKRDARTGSASDFAPGHGGTPPGQMDRNAGDAAVERPEPDSLERET